MAACRRKNLSTKNPFVTKRAATSGVIATVIEIAAIDTVNAINMDVISTRTETRIGIVDDMKCAPTDPRMAIANIAIRANRDVSVSRVHSQQCLLLLFKLRLRLRLQQRQRRSTRNLATNNTVKAEVGARGADVVGAVVEGVAKIAEIQRR